MKTAILAGCALAAVVIGTSAQGQQRLPRHCVQQIVKLCGTDRSAIRSCLAQRVGELSSECREEISQRAQARRGNAAVPTYPGEARPASRPDRTLSYGADARQTVHFYGTENSDGAPLVLFIHGGGWTFGNPLTTIHRKADHYTENGYAFASIGYRLVPDATVEDQAQDIVSAIKRLRREADELGFDPEGIVLIGHSAGAHLAALTGTHEAVSAPVLDSIRGIVLLDGAGYDVPRQIASPDTNYPQLYRRAFGNETRRQRDLSPITHVGGRDAPEWLILHVAHRDNAREQSETFAAALEQAGQDAAVVAVRGTSHNRMNQELGMPGDRSTEQVDRFLAQVLAR